MVNLAESIHPYVPGHPGKRPVDETAIRQRKIKANEIRGLTTMQKAKPKEKLDFVPSSKPTLVPPQPAALIAALRFLEIETIGEGLFKINELNLTHMQSRLKQLTVDETEKMKEDAERAKNKDMWSFLMDIATVILAAISTVLGMVLVGTGAGIVVGSIMVASGLLAIANFAFKEAEVWDILAKALAQDNEDLQQQLVTALPAAVGILSAVLGLVGTGGAMLWSQISLVEQVVAIAQTAASFAYGVTSSGNGVVQARSKWTEADLFEIKNAIDLMKSAVERKMDEMARFIESQVQIEKFVRILCNTALEINSTIAHMI